MSQTPQPEESPDEILARSIKHKEADRDYWQEEGFLERRDEIKQDLAILEAMRALRAFMKKWGYCDCLKSNTKTCEGCVALRQSDDAIRGMRG